MLLVSAAYDLICFLNEPNKMNKNNESSFSSVFKFELNDLYKEHLSLSLYVINPIQCGKFRLSVVSDMLSVSNACVVSGGLAHRSTGPLPIGPLKILSKGPLFNENGPLGNRFPHSD